LRLWGRFCLVLSARAVLALILGMTFWALAPLVLGWTTTTVMTGSMQPAIAPGDLVVSRPMSSGDLRSGLVLLGWDPDHPGRLRLHRIVRRDGDALITKGDANPTADSSPLHSSEVIGVGYMRVPYVGTPILLASTGDFGKLIPLLAATGLLVWLALLPAVRPDQQGGGPSSTTLGHTARGRATPSDRPASGLHRGVEPTSEHKSRRYLLATAGALSFALIALPGAAFASSFSASVRSSGWFAAARARPADALTCRNNANGTATVSWSYSAERPLDFDVLVDGRGDLTRVGPDTREFDVKPNSPFSFGRTSVIRIRTNLTRGWTATTASSVQVTTTTFLWFGVARCT